MPLTTIALIINDHIIISRLCYISTGHPSSWITGGWTMDKTTLVYNHRMIDFWLLVAKSIYALLLTENVGVNILSYFRT